MATTQIKQLVPLFLLVAIITEVAVDTCENAICPRFYNAECEDDACSIPPCRPQFFFRGRDVTNRCPLVERCSNKTCNKKRKCVEIIKPATCPSHNLQCHQKLKAKCVLVDPPPMSCDEIQCEKGTAC